MTMVEQNLKTGFSSRWVLFCPSCRIFNRREEPCFRCKSPEGSAAWLSAYKYTPSPTTTSKCFAYDGEHLRHCKHTVTVQDTWFCNTQLEQCDWHVTQWKVWLRQKVDKTKKWVFFTLKWIPTVLDFSYLALVLGVGHLFFWDLC